MANSNEPMRDVEKTRSRLENSASPLHPPSALGRHTSEEGGPQGKPVRRFSVFEPTVTPFAGRLGGNQAFVVDPNDESNQKLLREDPDAAAGMKLAQQFDLRQFRQLGLWKAAVTEGVGTSPSIFGFSTPIAFECRMKMEEKETPWNLFVVDPRQQAPSSSSTLPSMPTSRPLCCQSHPLRSSEFLTTPPTLDHLPGGCLTSLCSRFVCLPSVLSLAGMSTLSLPCRHSQPACAPSHAPCFT